MCSFAFFLNNKIRRLVENGKGESKKKEERQVNSLCSTPVLLKNIILLFIDA